MSVIFSIGVRIPGEGMGNHGYNTAEGLDRHHLLQRALVMQYHGHGIDRSKVTTFYTLERITFRLSRYTGLDKYVLRDNLFDWWISHQLEREHAKVFYGWNHIALWSIMQSKRLDMITILERANSHPLTYTRLLADEYKKHDIPHAPYHSLTLKKHLKEIEETDYIAVTSEFTKESLLEHGIDEQRILLTPLGVDTHVFTPAPIIEQDGIFKVVYIGQLCLRKGVQYLLEAWQKLQLQHANLVLIGDLVDNLEELLHGHLQQSRTISVRPHTTDPFKAYREASVFILPSLEDGFGLVVLEAMACGIPVIITEQTGAKDCVRHETDGFIIPPYSVESIADTLLYCYNNQSKLKRMGKHARQQAEKYPWKRYQDSIVGHIKHIID
ncbi:hypothetical protein CSB45_07675 [candidate division KSB3 bacterium]|uniref:Glycosyl transferase family 1 domain-containing protein n=1 Tax=candidate division KSB3 bacterium TaxID=2044937 RepID=A0A2G6E5P9_9BACT|nr:MAG: hypothetical protein CSB45_07675 [candidate division KSB3 bacterium]PIE29913.1 MAG: hypothetical protein CSA57_06380 [candidate division KSB3 bacterium]